jgi:hypothetical protein
MAVTFDAKTDSGSFSATTSKSFSHTVGTASPNACVFGVLCYGRDSGSVPSAASATYGGQAMTVGGDYLVGNNRVRIFYKASPLTGANTMAFSWSQTAIGRAGAISFYGVDQTTPVRAGSVTKATTNATVTVNVPSESGDYILGGIIGEDSFSGTGTIGLGAGQIVIFNGGAKSTNNVEIASSYEAAGGGATTAHSYTETVVGQGQCMGLAVMQSVDTATNLIYYY